LTSFYIFSFKYIPDMQVTYDNKKMMAFTNDSSQYS